MQIVAAIHLPTMPFVDNYTKHDYKAGTQNWSIVQDENNKMYFANNDGVLKFDGYNWQLCKIPNHSVVRSLCLIGGDSILAGAYNEFGIVSTNHLGELVFESWLHKIPEEYRNFQEVWRIHKLKNTLVIQSFNFMFLFKDGKFVKCFKPSTNYKYSFVVNKQIYIQELNKELFKLQGNELEPLPGCDIYTNKEIWSILSFNEDKLLIGTQLSGFYIFDGEKHTPWNTPANNFVKRNNLYSAIQLKNGTYCFGSIQNGLIIANSIGDIIVRQNTELGLHNNTVLSIYEDRHMNVWLGLDNGIDYLKTNLPLQHVSMQGGFGTGYASIIENNTLYAGTNQGLFYLNLDAYPPGSEESDFNAIDKTIGQVWNIKKVKESLYCCHNLGLNIIRGTKLEQTFPLPGVWNIYEIPFLNNELLIGTYQGLWVYNTVTRDARKLEGFDESARRIVFIDNNNLLVSHSYKGIYKLKINWSTDAVSIVELYNGTKYLPSKYNNEIFQINDQVIAATSNGLYEYDGAKFNYLTYWDNIIQGGVNQISSIVKSSNNKLWCFKNGKPFYITYLNSQMYEVTTVPFLPIVNTFPKGYENVLSISDNQFLIGNEDGFVLYNENYNVGSKHRVVLDISKAFTLNKDLLRWEGIDVLKQQDRFELNDLSFAQNSLKLLLSIPYFQQQALVHIRYRKNGGVWSAWLNGNIIEMNNLREGNYYVDIQCSIDKKEILNEKTLIFEITPPFYRTWQMYIVYLAAFFSIVLLLTQLVRKRIERVRRLENIKIEKRNIRNQLKLKQEAELAQSELIKLRNESLRTDIRHKSKELANTTMSIINKNKVLLQIKEVLIKLKTDEKKLDGNSNITMLIKKINKEIEHQDNWLVFEKNFDKVHENFLMRLKEKHSELTPKDLRLAAYLRMNLSSKEIAPLLNISIRSVEISRYRLRKKMNLEHDQNLTEYLIST